jgi:hypothetical protein
MHTIFWLKTLKRIDDLEYIGMDGRITLAWIFGKWDGEVWTVWVWFRLVTSGGLL